MPGLVTPSRIPTKGEIVRLEAQMRLMPQAEGLRTDHFFSGGMYCRRLWRPAGTVIVGKVHKAAHFFLCAEGEIIAWSETGMRRLRAGDVIESQPGTKRATFAVTDAIGITVHRTDLVDLDAIEAELIEPDETALFDAGNNLKSLLQKAGISPPSTEPYSVEGFRFLTKRVIAAEKPGFYGDWTDEERKLYDADDWESFSRSRGYSEEEINDYRSWRAMAKDGAARGFKPFGDIHDLAVAAATANFVQDVNGQIAKSSVIHKWMKELL